MDGAGTLILQITKRYKKTDRSLSVHSASYVALTSIERMAKNKKLYLNKTSIDLHKTKTILSHI